jgi:osmotically-inducible protein OsmY
VKEAARSRTKRAVDHARGAAARTRAQLANEFVDDDVLRDRVRSKLGHLVDAPIEVEVLDGRVVLSGNLTARGFDELINAISTVPGVQNVESRSTKSRATDENNGTRDARH